MRIAVCGAEASGKTTLCEGLAARIGSATLSDIRLDVLNEYPYDTLFEVDRLHPGTWEMMIRRQAEREAAMGDGVIDTPVLDLASLWIRWGWNRSTPEIAEDLLGLTKAALSAYSAVLIMPPVHVAPFEKRRFRHAENAAHMNGIVRSLITESGTSVPVSALEPGTTEQMLAAAATFVGR